MATALLSKLQQPDSIIGRRLRRLNSAIGVPSHILAAVLLALVADALLPFSLSGQSPTLLFGLLLISAVLAAANAANDCKKVLAAEARPKPEPTLEEALVQTTDRSGGLALYAVFGFTVAAFLVVAGTFIAGRLPEIWWLWPMLGALWALVLASTILETIAAVVRWETVPLTALRRAEALIAEGNNGPRVSVKLKEEFDLSLRLGMALYRTLRSPEKPPLLKPQD